MKETRHPLRCQEMVPARYWEWFEHICNRPVRAIMTDSRGAARIGVCGIHARTYERMGYRRVNRA